MYQRTALNVCREEEIPLNLKGSLVPYWHIISFYPIFLLKGILLVLMWIYSTWYIPVIVFAIDQVITTIIPIPHSFFLDKMEKRLSSPNVRLVKKEYIEENENLKETLLTAVGATRRRYNI